MERWLHQHIFKVGWLLTKNYQTTTVLYYTFFLPGVVLHELVYWLAAGVFNVRAERAIAFPEKQEIGELKLNFIRLSKKASPLKVAAISAVPPLVGLLVIWWIATNIFDISSVVTILTSGQGDALGLALAQLTAAPDFWLWLYVAFTVGNTMMPSAGALQGWRPVVLLFGIVVGVLVVAGLADDVGGAVQEPLLNTVGGLSSLFALIIVINAVGTALLSLIENTIERVTGDSATFKNGKMIGVRRSELLEQRKQEREKALKQRDQQKKPRPALPAGPPSVYRMPLPVPAFGTVPISPLTDVILEPDQPELLPAYGRRDIPTVIPGQVRESDAAPTTIPSGRPVSSPPTSSPPASLPSSSPAPTSMPLFNPGRGTRDADEPATEETEAVNDDGDVDSREVEAPRPRVNVPIAPAPRPMIEEDDDELDEDDSDADDEIVDEVEEVEYEEVDDDEIYDDYPEDDDDSDDED